MAVAEDLEVASFLRQQPEKLFIGGKWVEAAAVARGSCLGAGRGAAVGVGGGIIPWHFTLRGEAWKVGPGRAWGNRVVLKPAGGSPVGGPLVAKILEGAEIPAGVFNVVSG